MQWDRPELLLLLLVLPLALALGLWTLRWRARQIARFRADGGGELLVRRRPRRDAAQLALIGVVLALLAVAAAGPQWGNRDTEIRQQGVAVVVALDVSQSMAAEDQAPNRLAVAQRELDRLLERLQGDRVGLVIFGGDAFLRFPLTRDTVAARRIISALRPGEALVQPGSNLAGAIDTSAATLAASKASTRIILLVSDGENLDGNALRAARDAADAGLRLFSAGVGTEEGATIPIRTLLGTFTSKIDATTDLPVITRLDAQALETLARTGGGRLVRLTRAGALSELAADFNALQASTFSARVDSLPIERFQIVAGISLAVLLLAPLATAGRAVRLRLPRRALRVAAPMSVVVAAALVGAACASIAFSRNTDGSWLLTEGLPVEALEAYRDAQRADPDNVRVSLNLGRALHILGQYDRAITESSRGITSTDPMLRARAWYHTGNHRLAQGDLVGARDAYVESLLNDHQDFAAKFNLELVLRQLAPVPPPQEPPAEPAEDVPSDDMGDEAGGGSGDAQSADPVQPPDGGDPATAPPSGTGGDSGAGAADPRASDGPDGPNVPGSDPGEPRPSDPEAAQAALYAALENLNRENTTLEQALALLDALRQRQRRDSLFIVGAGDTPVIGTRDW